MAAGWIPGSLGRSMPMFDGDRVKTPSEAKAYFDRILTCEVITWTYNYL